MNRILITAALSLVATPLAAQETTMDWAEILGTTIAAPYDTPEHRAFDFWTGEWRAEWTGREEGVLEHTRVDAITRQRVFPALDGKVLIEWAEPINVDPDAADGRGFSIRYYIEDENRWVMAQHWPQPDASGIAVTDQLTGEFSHGRVELYSRRGRPNEDGTVGLRRYVFSDIHDDTFRWDGSNSDDEGATWLTWYVVPFTRLGATADLTSLGADTPNYNGGQLCTGEPHRNMDGIVGTWAGTVTATGETSAATLTAGRMLDGCATMAVVFHSDTGFRALHTYSYSDALAHWVEFRLDNQPGTRHSYRVTPDAEPMAFEDAEQLVLQNETERYLSQERFTTEAALTRTVFETMTEDELVIAEQVRENVEADWVDERRYELSRQE